MNQPPLNQDGVDALAFHLFESEGGERKNWDDPNRKINKRYYREIAGEAARAYLAVAQPVVNSVEELDKLPHETVIRDSEDYVFERIVQHGKDPEWWSTTDFLSETKVTLPARVLYRPEVDDA